MKCPNCSTENLSDSKFCKECAEPLNEDLRSTKTLGTSLQGLSAGSIFAGKYKIIEELGRGGMGWVYRAYDSEIEEYVAVKIIRPEIAADTKIIQRFRNELKIARKISQKNVCRMFDLNRDGDIYYITMEYVQGEDLKSSLRRMGPVSIGKAIFIAKQICEGLSEAHRLGITHRDLKPQNIMIDREGNTRIMDFGIARSRETRGITESGGVVGTAEYMSPEQVEGLEVDLRSDIYSLGIILYELVTGGVPFEGNTPMSVAFKRILHTPTEPQKINSQIPGQLSRVIMTCLNKDKDKRYQSAKELLADLSDLESQLPTTDRVIPKSKSHTSKEITVSIKPKKILMIAASICMVAAAVFLLWFFVFKQKGPVDVLMSSPKTEPIAVESEKREPESKPAEVKPQEQQEESRPPEPVPEKPAEKEAVLESRPSSPKKSKEQTPTDEQRAAQYLKQAQDAFVNRNFQACVELARKVLELDPKNVNAAELTRLAEEELARVFVANLVAQFDEAVNKKILPEFYRKVCTPEFYQTIKKDAEMIVSAFESLQSVTSNHSMQFVGSNRLQVSFSNVTTGVLKQGRSEEVLFDGVYTWEMEKIGETWTIINIKTGTNS